MNEENNTYVATLKRSNEIDCDIAANPNKYTVLTGDRPTGALHIGHYFGSLKNRVRLSKMGVPVMVVIADYQVLTDHDSFDKISQNTKGLVLDYLAAGLEPGDKVHIFPHSYIPEANQLLLPFLTLVTKSELERNPTVKTEIAAAALKSVNMGMYTYPVHQAVDILFCKANLVPAGKDQAPHVELTRTIARRFNEKYCDGKAPIFPLPDLLLSKAPSILGLDGDGKMSKSRGNTIMLSATEDETAALIKKAKTDSNRVITYNPDTRPEVSNLLLLISLCTGDDPVAIASRIGNGGSGALKKMLTEVLNETLRPIRQRREKLSHDDAYIRKVLGDGIDYARKVAVNTLGEVRSAMNMDVGVRVLDDRC